jgi:hypothetical protein
MIQVWTFSITKMLREYRSSTRQLQQHSHIQLCQSHTRSRPLRASVFALLVCSLTVFLQRVAVPQFEASAYQVRAAIAEICNVKKTDLVVLRLREAIRWHYTPFAICTYPQLWMHFVFRNDFARQDMTHEQVIVHRFCNDLGDGRRCEFDKSIVF